MELLFFNHALLYAILVAVGASLGMALVGPAGKWLSTAGLLLDITGLVQLDVSGLFSRTLDHYRDNDQFPHGPPSIMMREIMKEDHTFAAVAWLKRKLFIEPHTGLIIIVAGCSVQLIGLWM